jgi:hypothetical protein
VLFIVFSELVNPEAADFNAVAANREDRHVVTFKAQPDSRETPNKLAPLPVNGQLAPIFYRHSLPDWRIA